MIKIEKLTVSILNRGQALPIEQNKNTKTVFKPYKQLFQMNQSFHLTIIKITFHIVVIYLEMHFSRI